MITEEQLRALVVGVWDTLLGPTILPLQDRPAENVGESAYSSAVVIFGEWQATVCVACSVNLARYVAAVMFDKSVDAILESDVLDSMGEVANLMGGNVKALSNAECDLSLPVVERVGAVMPESVMPERRTTAKFSRHSESLCVSVLTPV